MHRRIASCQYGFAGNIYLSSHIAISLWNYDFVAITLGELHPDLKSFSVCVNPINVNCTLSEPMHPYKITTTTTTTSSHTMSHRIETPFVIAVAWCLLHIQRHLSFGYTHVPLRYDCLLFLRSSSVDFSFFGLLLIRKLVIGSCFMCCTMFIKCIFISVSLMTWNIIFFLLQRNDTNTNYVSFCFITLQ